MDFEKLKQEDFSFLYFTTKNCNVCKILKPKLKELSKKYKYSKFYQIDLDNYQKAAGYFMVFTVPTFLAYSKGQELIKVSRHFNVEEIKNKLDKYYKLIFE